MSMDLFQAFANHWKEKLAGTVNPDSLLLLAISGGIDSVVLAHLIARSGFNFEMAHMNFQLRGAESERDELFVRKLAQQLEVKLHVQRVNTTIFATEHKLSVQEAARELRYQWFAELRTDILTAAAHENKKHSGCWILTAHQADDNIETLLLHLFRGTGLEGLSGIQPVRKKEALIRPLLPFYKKELAAYAVEQELTFVEDSSNATDHYTRNKLRQHLMPVLQELFPEVAKQLTGNIDRFREGLQIYRTAVQQQIDRITIRQGEELHIPIQSWKQLNPLSTFTWEIIHPFGFHAAQIPEIIKLLEAETGKFCQSATHRIIRNRKHLVIAPLSDQLPSVISIAENDQTILFSGGTIEQTTIAYERIPMDTPANEIYISTAELKYPLLLRKWQQGDYFYPLGLNKKKKISKFLIDLKLSITDKEKVFVLTSQDKIIWVVGLRLDHRFRLQATSGEAMHLVHRK
ncbi:MAG: tRNA lysidine(34) synthetase TilS [Bacteroidota bacterium]